MLVFAQMKAMLDIIESDLLKVHMPSVTYMRMDGIFLLINFITCNNLFVGSVEPSKRQSIVNQFNSDPTIDLLLLTTHVGGLGLNLTGADTGIHYWSFAFSSLIIFVCSHFCRTRLESHERFTSHG